MLSINRTERIQLANTSVTVSPVPPWCVQAWRSLHETGRAHPSPLIPGFCGLPLRGSGRRRGEQQKALTGPPPAPPPPPPPPVAVQAGVAGRPGARMCGSLLLHALLLLQFTDVLLVNSKMRSKLGANNVDGQEVGMPDWEAFAPPRGPHFAPDSPKYVSAAVGSPAHVPCKARNLGSKSVSWIRHRDLHVLTVSSFTFTNDERFSAHRDSSTGDWVLVLRHPQPSDSGYYECSISTKPVTAISVKLEVVDELCRLTFVTLSSRPEDAELDL
ncbi:hypothetical protein O3P69_016364 [Scylla paramamosain]|uniref:Ig-like domain-containing protein n=1 Tax=Scylla paramamosain TaxID=85552 RepID=A0AAW0TCU6_SCYPA